MSSVEERVKKIVAEQLGVKEEEVTNTESQRTSAGPAAASVGPVFYPRG